MSNLERSRRIRYLDLAKGFAILFMFTQHTMLIHETGGGTSEHWLSVLFTLLGTAPAAPVFMLLMGVFVMKSKGTAKHQILRGAKVLGLGYLLNLLRWPMMLAGDAPATLGNMLNFIDILQLAGVSIIAGGVLKATLPRFTRSGLMPLMLVGILFVSPLLWGVWLGNPLFSLLWGTGQDVIFPVFPWIVYPLLGMYLSDFLIEPEGLDRRLTVLATWGGGMMTIAGLVLVLEVAPIGDYSRSGIATHGLITGFVFVWLKVCRGLDRRLRADGWFVRLMSFLSHKITLIYFLQWILFSWSILFLGANELGPYASAFVGLVVFVATTMLAKRDLVNRLFAFTKT